MDGKGQWKEVYIEKKQYKVDEIQLANLARPSQAISKGCLVCLRGSLEEGEIC